jgi:hypothetical protein
MRIALGAILLVAAVLVILSLRPTGREEKLIVRWPGAWIVVGLFLTLWVGTAVALIATGIYG